MSLPGGDPLQIALDAGQTPSPEMVAASPKIGSLRPGIAVLLLGIVFAAFGFSVIVARYLFLYRMVPMDKSADVLRERGRELSEEFGYSQADAISGFVQEVGYIDYLKNNDRSSDPWQHLMPARPSVLQFWYRTSPMPFVPLGGARVGENDPPQTLPGMVRLRLDTKGRLIFFRGVPPRVDDTDLPSVEFDFNQIFRESGLDINAFQPTAPQWTPPSAFDERRAFAGAYEDNPAVTVRIEAAAYRGKLVSFEMVEPWTVPPSQPLSGGASASVSTGIIFAIYFGVFFFSCWLAMRNIRERRSDTRGAFRVMLFLFVIRMVIWAFTTHHVDGQGGIDNFIRGLQSALYWSCFGGLIYTAFEPYMRRSAPERVISWNRLLAGDWRDPLIGRDILIGAAAGSIVTVQYGFLTQLMPRWLHQAPGSPFLINEYLSGLGSFPGIFLDDLSGGLLITFVVSFLILFLGLLLRRKWLGALAVWTICTVLVILQSIVNALAPFESVAFLLTLTCIVLLATRFGVLALISAWMFMNLQEIPFGTWYVGGYAAYIFTLFALAIFGFYTSTAGQKLWQGNLLDDGA
jgi:serine/threonine-protein kinase